MGKFFSKARRHGRSEHQISSNITLSIGVPHTSRLRDPRPHKPYNELCEDSNANHGNDGKEQKNEEHKNPQ